MSNMSMEENVREIANPDFDPRPPNKRNAATTEAARQILIAGLKDSATCAELLL